MRIVIDLQACQTEGSKGRGVARFSESLAAHIAQRIGKDDLRLCLNCSYEDSLKSLIDTFDLLVQRQHLTVYGYPNLDRQKAGERSAAVAVAETLVRRHWMSLQPDVLHVSHLFEGLVGDAVVPHPLPKVAGMVRSATLFDLIPLRFPEHYLANPLFSRWYHKKVGTLRECDHLLAISESTRADAIDLLGINPERITTIWGGVEREFRSKQLSPSEIEAFRTRFGVRGRFILYTGGDEYRKNLEGALAAYAELAAKLRDDIQLVIVCAIAAERRTTLLHKARKLRLPPNQVLITGFVAEEDLVTFYNLCDVFVFPSFYEGLGLPVIEAITCGAPTLGADNSSIRQIIARQDALFDARRPASLAERLTAVLTNVDFRDELRRHGVLRAKEFTWKRSAGIAHDALRAAHDRLKISNVIVAAGTAPKRRLALFTPLPPCRSGIADYNAAFLPFLSRYFDIDLFIEDYEVSDPYLRANFIIRSHLEFPARSREYDGILYDIGNSEFHAYMLDHLARYPGVVALHDAFLGGLYGYLDFNLEQTGRYSREMLGAHGPRARRHFAPARKDKDPVGATMLNLPATKSVLDRAIGVISHSPFNLKLAQLHYPEAWAAPYKIINQMVRVPIGLDATRRQACRADLGFCPQDFIVCTFGHVVWTKCGDVLLESFAQSALAGDPNAKLVYVGELARDHFGHKLSEIIKGSELRHRIMVTGYLDQSQYAKYLAVADIAVQLRTHSRGGTPKGVLDCLAHGIPVIVNNAASYTDYPDDVVRKIGAIPDVVELAEELTSLSERRATLVDLGNVGRQYIIREHDPDQIAAQYALSIEEFTQRGKAIELGATIHEIAGALVRSDAPEALVDESAAMLHESLSRSLFTPQRVLIDVTHIAGSDQETGIQRVVKKIVHGLYCSSRPGFVPVAVRLEGGCLVEATEWLNSQGLLSGAEEQRNAEGKIELRWGDCLLMLDSSWARYSEFLPTFERIRRVQGKVYTVIYDLLLLQFPQFWGPSASDWFQGWLKEAIASSDGLVCISRAVADEIDKFASAYDRDFAAPKRLGFWHLGGDFVSMARVETAPTERVLRATAARSFLMVGTIEPRKNHSLALDAMEILWSRNVETNLCIAGKPGWMVDDFMTRLSAHPELGRRLHFVERPTDEELQYCYANSTALLFPSAGEGFGLPLIEAARFGTPILASDIAVFREIAGEHATYFRLGTPDELAAVLETWLHKAAVGEAPQSRGMHCLTWEESAEELLEVLVGNRWYKLSAKG